MPTFSYLRGVVWAGKNGSTLEHCSPVKANSGSEWWVKNLQISNDFSILAF